MNDLIVVIGAFGSGKSEYSINLAREYKEKQPDKNISLVDLDVVNPYFRSRFIRERFIDADIEVIAPEFKYGHADVPMISPKIKGAINDETKTVILDVGGDPVGCRALGRFTDDIVKRGYKMQFVVNTKRPFTSNIEDIIIMKEMLEGVSHLEVTELVCNTNLMQLTTLEIITEGINILKNLVEQENILFNKYLVLNDTDNKYPEEILGIKKMNMDYYLSKPWETLHSGNSFC
jgi:hypothetical protein